MDTWPNHQVVLKRIKSQFEEKERATTEIQKVNSELSHQVTELQDQLQAERESTQERINFECAKRENLEERLKEERAETERLLEEERRSTLEFEKNMMAKFAQFSQQTQTHQMDKKRTNEEISNPNLQNTLLQTASTTGTLGTRHNVIAPNMLIQAANIRMFRAMVSGSKD
ncbi:epidermal growth factor receptor substrate 15-like [Triticum urartu]|uniref:epidermal growth factor receptor substrate 15-like n=1 Tax=Triticum urartu TaxID=4572 RepID=UPI0020439DF7|nr:epidermal growth factor receptor substrate 15-like [Triticum urartu]